jgi:hypothetical protein
MPACGGGVGAKVTRLFCSLVWLVARIYQEKKLEQSKQAKKNKRAQKKKNTIIEREIYLTHGGRAKIGVF